MADIESKITSFTNRAITRSREIVQELIDEYDRVGYQSPKSVEKLAQVTEAHDFIDLLDSDDRGNLTTKQINNLIDFFYDWLDLYKVVLVNYTNYQVLIQGQIIQVPADYYALEDALQTEIATRTLQVAQMTSDIDELNHVLVTMTAHGFAVKDVLTINAAGALLKVSDPDNEKRIGLVVEVISANKFRLALFGYVSGLSALVAGTVYYAQASGAIGTTVTGMAVLVASSATAGYMLPQGYLNEHRSDNAVAVGGATVTLDMKNFKKRSFKAAATITAPKTWAIANDTNAKTIEIFVFTLDAAHAQTMPANVKMPDPRLVANVWTPDVAGDYVMSGKFDGTTWWLEIMGPWI